MSKTTNKDLSRALAMEKQRNALLEARLKQTRCKKKHSFEWSEEPIDDGDSSTKLLETCSSRGSSSEIDHDTSIFTSMSFASLNIVECKPIDGEDEVDKKSFENWKELLEASMQFAKVKDEFSKISIFKIKAGCKLMEVLDGTSTRDDDPDMKMFPYSNVMSRLKRYFNSRDYVLLQRQRLRSMTQQSDESDLKYVKRVTAVAKLCDYGEDQLMENIADVVQSHALNLKVREAGRKVMRKGGSLTEFLDKIRGHEIEKLNEQTFLKNHQQYRSDDQQIATVASEQRNPAGKFRPSSSFRFVSKPQGPMFNQSRMAGSFRGRELHVEDGTEVMVLDENHAGDVPEPIIFPMNVMQSTSQKLQTIARKRPNQEDAESSTPSKARKIAAICETDQDETIDEKDFVSAQ
ncbi:uncharacterized protein LOC134219106 [Armigeres subalbatus]|uniref:uncharacterized protein LOC134219106 n=1 Tax=Armigeres subalbatus TaxID=124917 RepID=UPI002ED4095D